jgi:hypothetical protein
MAALGMVLMIIGGLLLLSATRGYALYRANRRQPATRIGGAGWIRMLAVMLVCGGALIALGYVLAF